MAWKIKFAKVVLFLAGLVLLQQVIAFAYRFSPQWHDQSSVIIEHDIDPSALFYMESRQALAAEKAVRRAVSSP